MKKIFLLFAVFLITISFVLAAAVTAGTDSDASQVGQGTGDGTQSNTETETQNQGEETNLQNQIQVQSGNYMNSEGKQMQIQTNGELKIQVGNAEAKSSLELTQEQDMVQNRTKLKTTLSNGKNVEIKIMPDTASEKAIERLRLVNCVAEEGCSIELKEVGTGEQVKAVYEVKTEKEARVLALFKTRMAVQAQVDAETGEVVQARKPWWAFLASE